ncbi:serine/threonine-protein phosphatase 4 regulatory subunit 4-like [Chrysoperla carnea]|uniref:serine/threonine-protein phosphatase 4 regulatory subunit 4-like n=1 Tax=Chrysoperla carnea TaxID=189513 RepID=UPI001D06C2F3|nr:serine/threonine-protein phosphatase 4 regulatory subunit 4-like [Chrysoperla carnea]
MLIGKTNYQLSKSAIMDEELRQLQLDKRIKGKSEQLLRQHSSISSDLAPVERACQLLNKGDEIQRINVLNSLPELAMTEKQAVYNKLLPKVISLLPQSSAEFQIVAAKMFRMFAERNLSVSTLLPVALTGLQHVDATVLQAWSDALMDVIPRLSGKVIQSQVLSFIMKDLQKQSSKQKKMSYARLLGVISEQPAVEVAVVKSFLNTVIDLSRDPIPEVRGTMCLQYPAIVEKIGLEKSILEYIAFFGKDENPIVRGSLLSVIGLMCKDFSQDSWKIHSLIDVCSNADDDTKIILAKEIGILSLCLSNCASAKELSFIINVYQKLSMAGLSVTEMKKGSDPSRSVATRQQCAMSLPQMTNFIMSKPNIPEDVIYAIIKTLTSDPCYAVRRQAANNFQDIVKFMGNKINILIDIFLRLLRDSSDDVLVCLIPNLSGTLNQYAKQGVLQTKKIDTNINEFGRSLLKCQANVFKLNHWRIQAIYLRQIEFLPAVFPSDYINTQFLPVIFNIITKGGPKPVRKQAIRTVLKFLRYNIKQEQRNNMRIRLVSEIARSQLFYTRILFISMCNDCLDIFSTEYFKTHFCEVFLSLADDEVPNIRLLVLTFLPRIKRFFFKPNDNNLIAMLDKLILKRNEIERDIDCRKILNSVIVQVRSINIITQKTIKCPTPLDQRLYQEEIRFDVFV